MLRSDLSLHLEVPVNEHQLGRLLRRLVLLSAPLPLAALGAACGGASTADFGEDGGSNTQGGKNTVGGAAHAGNGSGGSSAGEGGSVVGTGGTIVVGTGGSVVGTAGNAAAGAGGSATAGAAGAGGALNCGGHADAAAPACSPAQAVVPKGCIASAQATVGTQLAPESCKLLCGPAFSLGCSVAAVDATTVTVQCQPGCAVGRRPAGLGGSSTCDTRAAGSYFAEIAHLEAASVTAFRILRDELRANGAPKKLVRAAGRAARDEIRHTRATGALARRFGATPRVPSIEPAKPRSLEAMALENAVEGCVRETYGALLATRQAKLATDPVVRAAMRKIARDETRHASLSWQVGRWLETRLDRSAKRNVARAKQAAASQLIAELGNEPEVEFAGLAGLPSPTEAAQLAIEMRRTLWS
jgi:hypothetical protein